MIPKGLVKVKAALYLKTDVEGRRHREQTGLDTPVVFAVNYECHRSDRQFNFVIITVIILTFKFIFWSINESVSIPPQE